MYQCKVTERQRSLLQQAIEAFGPLTCSAEATIGLIADVRGLEAERDALRSMLRDFRWVRLTTGLAICAGCGRSECKPDCRLAALLKEGE